MTLERVPYHPEAIALRVSPASTLAPVLAAARDATREALGPDAGEGDGEAWMPHLTLCYATGEQPAAPVIAELGRALPARKVTVGEMSLVVHDGAEKRRTCQRRRGKSCSLVCRRRPLAGPAVVPLPSRSRPGVGGCPVSRLWHLSD